MMGLLYIHMNKLTIIPVRKITKWQAAKVPELFTHLDESYETTQLFAVYDPDLGKTAHSGFVGAMMVNFECFAVKNGKFIFDIYIDKFEIAKHKHGKGYGRAMYEAFLSKYNVPDKVALCHVALCHVITIKDGGASYRFWRHMGFHKPDADFDRMEKTYR